jgi:hypothetical protein
VKRLIFYHQEHAKLKAQKKSPRRGNLGLKNDEVMEYADCPLFKEFLDLQDPGINCDY